jgi:spore maturation protein CgeB
MAQSPAEMLEAMQQLLREPAKAEEQASCGLETVLARHTCNHRAEQLTEIYEELCA